MITHEHRGYIKLRRKTGKGKFNGCYYYSQEIVNNIIPRVHTWRDWNTVGKDLDGMCDHMIVFLHDNSTPWNYEWLHKYDDLVLVCSSKYTMDSVKWSGHAILLPMSIDTEYVKQFRTEKTKETCFVGNAWVRDNIRGVDESAPRSCFIPGKVDYLSGLKREKLLKKMAQYRKCYAIDRCAQEAKVLGCELLRLDTRYSVDNVGVVLDNRDAAKILQEQLNNIDKEVIMSEFRVMKGEDAFLIQQNDGDGWETIGEMDDIEKARHMVRDLRGQR